MKARIWWMSLAMALSVVAVVSAAAAGKSSVAVSTTTMNFLTKAVQSGQAEVELGAVAVERAQESEVRSLAEQMITEHARMNAELAQLAAANDWKLSDKLAPSHRAIKAQLMSTEPAKFDLAYLNAVAAEHDQAVKLFEQFAKSGREADLKAWVERTLPTLREHQSMVQKLIDHL